MRNRMFVGMVAFVAALAVVGLGASCDANSKTSAESTPKEEGESAPKSSEESSKADSDRAAREVHEHDMRLGLKMQDLGRRFAAVWYAGKAARPELTGYHLHELRETVEQIKQADIEEHGLKVGEELEARVVAKLEGLHKAVEEKNIEAFRSRYRSVVKQCNSCHAAAKHDFIDITVPTRNPFANVRFSAEPNEDGP